ncbi:MAG: rod shape-determining protein MreC [Burkholderiales bacterium]|nr:rod shape-determining protein MreC [Burkholderiales bacterium]
MHQQPPAFFHRGPAPLARVTFFAVLSILLMVLDARFRYAEPLRQVLALAAYPIQQVATAPVVAFRGISDFFASRRALQRENETLRTEQLRTAPEILTLEALKAENDVLRDTLAAKAKLAEPSIFAEVVYAGRDPFSRKVMVDKGAQQGVRLGQPVIDAHGVIGQVTRVHPLLAEVTLIVEKDHAVPVQVVRNGLRGVVYGSGDGATLELRHLAANAEVEPGDLLVTSGIDGVYPRGLPVAKVVEVERGSTLAFANIVCQPVADVGRNRQVLVLNRGEELPPPPAAEVATKKPVKAKRQRRVE